MNTTTFNLKQLFNDKKVRLQAFIASMVLAVGFVLSVAGFVELQAIAHQQLYLQTQQHTAVQLKQIQTNIDISLDSLSEIANLYHASGDVSRSLLATYVKSDTKYHSGTVALGWVPKIESKNIDSFQKQTKKIDPNFAVYEITGHGMPTSVSKNKPIYPVKFIMSLTDKRMKAGLNLASIPSRERVFKKAARTQETAITQRLSLYLNNRRFYGFQAYHPIFNRNELGQDQLVGFVMGNYDIRALIEDVFLKDDHQVDIVLYDANTSSQQLLYSSTKLLKSVDDIGAQQGIHWTYTLKVADQKWILVVLPNLKVLTGTPSWLPYSGLIAGAVITLLLTLYLFIALVRTRQLALLSTDLAGTTSELDIQTKLKQEADRANQAKSGLLTAASHDLRQPLHTIGLLTTLLKDSHNKKEQIALIDKVLVAVDGMNALFTSLLDINLLESHQLPVNRQHFYLQDLLDKLTLDFTLQAEDKKLHFSVVETSICVFTDPILLERILRNLLSNAVRYTLEGKILLGCRRYTNHIRICVLDTGIGLSEEAKDKIFDSFYRDKQAKQLNDQGLGLGLSIVEQTAKLLELNLGIQSKLGKGSAFYVDVPYGDPKLIGEIETTNKLTTIDKLIWIIEDDNPIRFSLQKILQSWQCRVESIASGSDVQQLLKHNYQQPDAIIADYQLINETGLELIIKIRNHYKSTIPAIIITGTTQLEVREKIENSACKFVMKPIKSDELNNVLHHLFF